jgi:adenylate cyclase
MNTKRMHRKLSAILSADVKGYSRLMGEDEEATVSTLKRYREVLAGLIQQYRGRVVDSPGDNMLAEFPSVVDAAECAVEIQKELQAKNVELHGARRMEFRIGINLGDIIQDEERIYGDGVNIAARMESLADGGGICISGTVFDSIENKVALSYEYLGEKTVKNISKPVRAYRVLFEQDATHTENVGEFDLPDRPSIAVLPFTNMSGDPDQEYFSDGITEDLITDLSKITGLFVIARNSVFTYKGKAVKVQNVSRELGVRYVLEGSVRKAGDRVRITSQLVDATTGGHLWADRYDRDLSDIFALQDEVTEKIVAVLAVKLGEGEQQRLMEKQTGNVMAYDYFLRGLGYANQFTKEANDQARKMFHKAIELDPEFAITYGKLGFTYLTDWIMGWSRDPQSLDRALELGKKARSLNESLPEAYCLLGETYLWKKQHERAVSLYETAIELNPNNAEWYSDLGGILNFADDPERGIDLIMKAMRLDPLSSLYTLFNLGHAQYLVRRYDEAEKTLNRALKNNPDFIPARAILAATYIETDRPEEARREAAEMLKRSPETTLEIWRQRLPYKDPALMDRCIDALREAGLK